MKNTVGRFDYEIKKASKDSKMSWNPFVHLCLQGWGTAEDGRPIISTMLMTDQEIDTYVYQLKDDLDAVAKRAKIDLRKANEETLGFAAFRNALK